MSWSNSRARSSFRDGSTDLRLAERVRLAKSYQAAGAPAYWREEFSERPGMWFRMVRGHPER